MNFLNVLFPVIQVLLKIKEYSKKKKKMNNQTQNTGYFSISEILPIVFLTLQFLSQCFDGRILRPSTALFRNRYSSVILALTWDFPISLGRRIH